METYHATTAAEYAAQGKSNNYLAAQEEGRLTDGQAAKLLSQRLGRRIKARQIEPLAIEFHHAGRFGANKARRVFFFSIAEIEALAISDIERASAPVPGWVLGFRAERDARGRRVYLPIVADAGLIPADRARRLGDKFHRLTEAEAAEAKAAIGKTLPAFGGNWREAR